MKIQEVLDADMNIDRLDITIRNTKLLYVMEYCIGRDEKPGYSERFVADMKVGTLYTNSDMKILYMNRIIQHCQLPDLPRTQQSLRGVIDKSIPKELRKLSVYQLQPYHGGYSDDLHGYRITCLTDNWAGIEGEYEQIEMEDEDD